MNKALIVVNLAGFLTFLWNDINTLQEMGYTVEVAMNVHMPDGSNAVEVEKLEKLGIKFHHVDFNTKKPLSKNNIVAYRQLKSVLKEKYNLIHCHTPIVGILTRLLAQKYRKDGTKVIYTTHGFTFTDRSTKKNWLVYFSAEKIMSYYCDAIVTINHEDYNNAKKMHCKHVYLLPSVGLDNSRFRKVVIDRNKYREQFGISSNELMVLAVGELSKRKNHQIVIKAIAEIEDSDKYIFVICGRAIANSTIQQELQELANRLGVRIVFAGHRHDIAEINACADVAVIPSIREGFGMTGVEALASGVPVVGSDVQGIREYVIPGKTGYLCNPFDEHQFADAIKKISEMSFSEREKIAVACKQKAEEFDVSKSISAMKNIYQEVLCYDK